MGFITGKKEDFQGKGVTLPLVLENGGWPIQTGSTLIKESIRMILAWVIGTRPFLNEFGSRLDYLLEEPNDDVLREVAYELIAEAILTWEKRIELIDVEIDRPNAYSINFRLRYVIIKVQKEDTFIYPFYTKLTT